MNAIERCLRCAHRKVCKKFEALKKGWNYDEYGEWTEERARVLGLELASAFNIQVPGELLSVIGYAYKKVVCEDFLPIKP